MPSLPRIYRLRRTAGVGGGHVLVAQADVYGFSETFVMLAAHEGRVRNWRNIDKLDVSKVKVRPQYQFIGEVPARDANEPSFPVLKRFQYHVRK